ncbi:MAG TPA: hypothetical protein VIW26_05565, partial [Gemmatimonadales bacterium]
MAASFAGFRCIGTRTPLHTFSRQIRPGDGSHVLAERLWQHAPQLGEHRFEPAVHVELRPQAEDVRDLPGGQFLVEPEVEQQLIARLEAVEGGLQRRGAVGPVRPAFGIGRRIADGGRVQLLADHLD